MPFECNQDALHLIADGMPDKASFVTSHDDQDGSLLGFDLLRIVAEVIGDGSIKRRPLNGLAPVTEQDHGNAPGIRNHIPFGDRAILGFFVGTQHTFPVKPATGLLINYTERLRLFRVHQREQSRRRIGGIDRDLLHRVAAAVGLRSVFACFRRAGFSSFVNFHCVSP